MPFRDHGGAASTGPMWGLAKVKNPRERERACRPADQSLAGAPRGAAVSQQQPTRRPGLAAGSAVPEPSPAGTTPLPWPPSRPKRKTCTESTRRTARTSPKSKGPGARSPPTGQPLLGVRPSRGSCRVPGPDPPPSRSLWLFLIHCSTGFSGSSRRVSSPLKSTQALSRTGPAQPLGPNGCTGWTQRKGRRLS